MGLSALEFKNNLLSLEAKFRTIDSSTAKERAKPQLLKHESVRNSPVLCRSGKPCVDKRDRANGLNFVWHLCTLEGSCSLQTYEKALGRSNKF
jgi:hypothetical protein